MTDKQGTLTYDQLCYAGLNIGWDFEPFGLLHNANDIEAAL